MTAATQRSRTGGVGPRQVLLRILFAIALWIPVGTLFQAQWRSDADRVSLGDQERRGVEYLRALSPLTTALIGAQSAAVAERTVAADALMKTVQDVNAVDERLGLDLATTERWADLRTKIGALAGRAVGDGPGAYSAYVDVTDLLLALYGKVRENSGLIQDPDVDAFYLQDAVAEELPEAQIGLGRLADLTTLASAGRADDPVQTTAGLIVAQHAVTGPAADLTEDFLVAVSGTESRTLSTTMLGRIDAFRFVMDKVASSTAFVDGDITTADAAAAAVLRTDGTTAGAALADAVLTELDSLLAKRLSDIRFERDIALAADILAVALSVVPTLVALVAWRRSARRRRSEGRAGTPATEDSGAIVAEFPPWHSEPSVLVGRRERSGAAR